MNEPRWTELGPVEHSEAAPTASDTETRALIEEARQRTKRRLADAADARRADILASPLNAENDARLYRRLADALEAAALRSLPTLSEPETRIVRLALDHLSRSPSMPGAMVGQVDALARKVGLGGVVVVGSESTDARRVATPGFAEADDDEAYDLRSAFFFIGDTDRTLLDKAARFDNNAHGPTLSDEWFANVVVVVEGIVEREVDRRAGVVVPRTEVDSRFAEWWANAGRRVTPESSREGLGYVAFCAGVRFGVSQPAGPTGATGEPVTARAGENVDAEA